MIDQDSTFLPFFFQEPVYLVPDSAVPQAYAPLGENRRQILVLVEEADELYLSESNKALLEKILQAVQLTLADVHLINVVQAQTPDAISGAITFNTCISFGMPPEAWQFSNFSRKYAVMVDETDRAFLWADTLTEIAEDVEKKKSLWLNLKNLFLAE